MHLSLLKRVPLFIWLLLSLQCLISALTQAGGGVSCSGSLVQWCCGEGGALQTNVTACVGSARLTARVLHCSGSRLLSRERALPGVRFPFSGPPQKRGLSCACALCLPRPSSSGGQELDARSVPGCGAPHPLRGPSLFPHVLVAAPCVCSGELVSSRDPPG